jgi:hypothetical protein
MSIDISTQEQRRLVDVITHRVDIDTPDKRRNLLDAAGLTAPGIDIVDKLTMADPTSDFAPTLVRTLRDRGRLNDTGQPALCPLLEELARQPNVIGDASDLAFVKQLWQRLASSPAPHAGEARDHTRRRVKWRKVLLAAGALAIIVVLFGAAAWWNSRAHCELPPGQVTYRVLLVDLAHDEMSVVRPRLITDLITYSPSPDLHGLVDVCTQNLGIAAVDELSKRVTSRVPTIVVWEHQLPDGPTIHVRIISASEKEEEPKTFKRETHAIYNESYRISFLVQRELVRLLRTDGNDAIALATMKDVRRFVTLHRGALQEIAAADVVDTLTLLGDMFNEAMQAREAVAAYDEALQWDHCVSKALYNRGMTQLELERYSDAYSDLCRYHCITHKSLSEICGRAELSADQCGVFSSGCSTCAECN